MQVSLNNKIVKIFLFYFLCPIIFPSLTSAANSTPFKSPFYLRNISENYTYSYRCENSPKKLLEKYKNEKIEAEERNSQLDKYQEALKEIIETKKIGKISKYLPKIIIFFIFLIVDVLLIIMWIASWFICCCRRKKKTEANGCSKCALALFWLLSIIFIAICVFAIFLFPSVYKSVNGVLCSFYKLIFHFIYGTQEDFTSSNWKGFEGIENLIANYNLSVETSYLYGISGNYTEFLYNIKVNNTDFIRELKIAGDNIEKVSSPLYKFKNEVWDNIHCEIVCILNYHGYMYVLLGVFGGLSLFQLLSLTPYLICEFDCLSCLFHLLWNIQMPFLIIFILFGVIFGTVGVISKEMSSLLYYTINSTNLLSDSPFLLDIDPNYKNQINSCFNGDGNLTASVYKGTYKFDEPINQYYKEFEEYYSTIQDQENNKNSYGSFYNKMKTLKSLYDDLNSQNISKIFDCSFINYDVSIISS